MYDVNDGKENLDMLFKRLHIVLHERFDEKYPDLRYNEEIRYSDFHETIQLLKFFRSVIAGWIRLN
jgi:hypothetical protein